MAQATINGAGRKSRHSAGTKLRCQIGLKQLAIIDARDDGAHGCAEIPAVEIGDEFQCGKCGRRR